MGVILCSIRLVGPVSGMGASTILRRLRLSRLHAPNITGLLSSNKMWRDIGAALWGFLVMWSHLISISQSRPSKHQHLLSTSTKSMISFVLPPTLWGRRLCWKIEVWQLTQSSATLDLGPIINLRIERFQSLLKLPTEPQNQIVFFLLSMASRVLASTKIRSPFRGRENI